MRILEMKNLTKKDLPLHYRKEFLGQAVFETMEKKKVEKRIEFSLEHSPTGKIDVKVKLLEDLDYPLVPALNRLKDYIYKLEQKGKLP
ncbi:MAG: hypothetical protein ACLFR1_08685 [Spirochaetia bacterium]